MKTPRASLYKRHCILPRSNLPRFHPILPISGLTSFILPGDEPKLHPVHEGRPTLITRFLKRTSSISNPSYPPNPVQVIDTRLQFTELHCLLLEYRVVEKRPYVLENSSRQHPEVMVCTVYRVLRPERTQPGTAAGGWRCGVDRGQVSDAKDESVRVNPYRHYTRNLRSLTVHTSASRPISSSSASTYYLLTTFTLLTIYPNQEPSQENDSFRYSPSSKASFTRKNFPLTVSVNIPKQGQKLPRGRKQRFTKGNITDLERTLINSIPLRIHEYLSQNQAGLSTLKSMLISYLPSTREVILVIRLNPKSDHRVYCLVDARYKSSQSSAQYRPSKMGSLQQINSLRNMSGKTHLLTLE
ncbi:hypothetical protein J6590_035208 [Homalodisca vitripennis]|nr:hypothetical protein J6590_035208 [Homalodisca vitripennis]